MTHDMSHESVIAGILALLDSDHDTVQEFMRIDEKCTAQLVSLDDEQSSALARVTRELMATARDEEDNEYKLQVMLRALTRRRQPEAFDLIAEALASENTEDKETYIAYLLELGSAHAIPPLERFVASDRPDGGEGAERARSLAIEALRNQEARGSAPTILGRLNDAAPEVRKAAAEFFLSLNISSAATAFEQRLQIEDEPDIIKVLVDGLRNWNTTRS